jgi:hypothetical protein
MLGGAIKTNPQTKYPTAEAIACAITWAALYECELSAWVKNDEAALEGRIELRSRWTALAALLAAYPGNRAASVGGLIGCGSDAIGGLARARVSPWWSDDRVRAVMVRVVGGDDVPFDGYGLGCDAIGGVRRALPGLISERAARRGSSR